MVGLEIDCLSSGSKAHVFKLDTLLSSSIIEERFPQAELDLYLLSCKFF